MVAELFGGQLIFFPILWPTSVDFGGHFFPARLDGCRTSLLGGCYVHRFEAAPATACTNVVTPFPLAGLWVIPGAPAPQ